MMDKAKILLISGIIGISISLSMCMPISITAVAAYPYPYPYDGMIRYWHPSMPYYGGINPWLGVGGGWINHNNIIIYPGQGMPLMPPVISVPMPIIPSPSPVIIPAPVMPGPVIPGGTIGQQQQQQQQQQHNTQTCAIPSTCTRTDQVNNDPGGKNVIDGGGINFQNGQVSIGGQQQQQQQSQSNGQSNTQTQHSTQTCNPPGSCTRNDMIGGDHFIQSGHVNNFGQP